MRIFILLVCFINITLAETGVSDNLILLGQSAAFTGPAAELGKEYRKGAMLYFDYINSQGGVYGRKIYLLSLDDGYEPDKTIANTQQLIEQDKVFALFGYVGTPTSKAVLPLFTQAKMPFFAPFTGAELLRNPVNKYIFNIRASYYQETEALVEYLLQQGLDNIAVFYQNDSYGEAGLAGVKLAMNKHNLAISATGTVERNTINVNAAVNTIKTSNPDAVIMISAYKSCAEFIRQAKKQGLDKTKFLNVSFVGSKALISDLWVDGKGVVISQVVPFPAENTIPIVREYNEFLNLFNPLAPISYGSLEGFIAAKIFVHGLEVAGADLTREKLIQAFESFGQKDFGGFRINWNSKNHQGVGYVDITIIGENKRWLY